MAKSLLNPGYKAFKLEFCLRFMLIYRKGDRSRSKAGVVSWIKMFVLKTCSDDLHMPRSTSVVMFLLTPSSALNEVKICYGLKLNAILYALLYFTIDQNPFSHFHPSFLHPSSITTFLSSGSGTPPSVSAGIISPLYLASVLERPPPLCPTTFYRQARLKSVKRPPATPFTAPKATR